MTKLVSYDFEVTNYASVKAPRGVDPDTLLDQALESLLSKARNNEIDFECKQIFDGETGEYSPAPEYQEDGQ